MISRQRKKLIKLPRYRYKNILFSKNFRIYSNNISCKLYKASFIIVPIVNFKLYVIIRIIRKLYVEWIKKCNKKKRKEISITKLPLKYFS